MTPSPSTQAAQAAQEPYNGWTNWETWSAALWLSNDEVSHKESLRCVSPARLKILYQCKHQASKITSGPVFGDHNRYRLVNWQEIYDSLHDED